MNKTNKILLSIAAIAATSGATIGIEKIIDNSSNVLVTTDNGGKITKDDVTNELYNLYGASVIEQKVQELVLEENYKVTDDEIKAELAIAKGSYSDEEFKTLLNTFGYSSEEELKELLKYTVLSRKASLDGIEASKADVKKYYEENSSSYTTINLKQINVEDADLANKIYKEIDGGKTFEEIISDYSLEESSSVGIVIKDSIDPTISEVVFTDTPVKKETLFKPIQTNTGYAIVAASDEALLSFNKEYSSIEKDYKLSIAPDTAEVTKKLKEKSKVRYADEDLEKKIEQVHSQY